MRQDEAASESQGRRGCDRRILWRTFGDGLLTRGKTFLYYLFSALLRLLRRKQPSSILQQFSQLLLRDLAWLQVNQLVFQASQVSTGGPSSRLLLLGSVLSQTAVQSNRTAFCWDNFRPSSRQVQLQSCAETQEEPRESVSIIEDVFLECGTCPLTFS